MDPPMVHSVVKLNEQRFRLGSSMICEKSNAKGDPKVLTSWQDEGMTWVLRPQAECDRIMPSSSSAANMVAEGGTCQGTWAIGDSVLCKVRAWREDMGMEQDTINLVKTHCPNIPRYEVAQQVAKYSTELARVTSSRWESAKGKGVQDYHLNDGAGPGEPSWRPRLVGPIVAKEFDNFLRSKRGQSTHPMPNLGPHTFHFQHNFLGPHEIMVSEENAKVTGLVDWDCAGFYPKFWLTLKPQVAHGFHFPWSKLLVKALMAEGFAYSHDYLTWWESFWGATGNT